MLEVDFSPFPILGTERLLLRRMVKTDLPEILRLRGDDRVMQYIDRKKASSLEDAEEWFNIVEDAINNNNGITWAITLKQDPSFMIGSIGLWRFIKEHFRAEVGYMLKTDFWRQGIMKEALKKVIEYGFDELRLHSIEAQINSGNTASANILLNSGFVQEAHFKENYFFQGVFKDTIVFSILEK